MKRFVILFSTVLFAAASFKASAIKRVEIEPRMGYSLSVESGAHAAMLVGLPLAEKFSLRGGLYYSKTDFLDLLVPIYASFQIQYITYTAILSMIPKNNNTSIATGRRIPDI